MVVLAIFPSSCSLRSTQGPAHSTTSDAHTSSKGKASRPDQLCRVSNMSRTGAERDSCPERVCILLSLYLRPRGESGQVPSDACTSADMAIEEGHGVDISTDKVYLWIGLDLMHGSIYVLLYLVTLNFASFLHPVYAGTGGPATSG